MYSMSYEAIQRILAAMDTANIWDAATVHLIKADFIPAPTMVIADLTEADFDGYTAHTITPPPAAVFIGEAGDMVVQFDDEVWSPTGSATPNTIFGYWIQSTWGGTGQRLLIAGRFATGVDLAGPLNAVTVTPYVFWGQARQVMT